MPFFQLIITCKPPGSMLITAAWLVLSVGNVNGRITALCLAFDDLLEFKLTMRHTLGTYLDAENFANGNQQADPTQETIEVWYIDQKTNEDGETVTWELASPGDVGGESIGRQATTLCRWCLTGGYKREWGLEFEAFKRADGWWERKDSPSLYEANYEAAGFYRVDQPQRGDMVVMEVGRTVYPNHAGIFLGADPALPGEDAATFSPGPFLLHHLYGRSSEIIVFGGPWLDRTRLVLRHKDARYSIWFVQTRSIYASNFKAKTHCA